MRRHPAKRLELLSRIAEVKATRAKAEAAQEIKAADALEAKRQDLLARRARVQPALSEPGIAQGVATWMTLCADQVQAAAAETARARAEAEDARAKARREEGRRQVLEKLRNQAS